VQSAEVDALLEIDWVWPAPRSAVPFVMRIHVIGLDDLRSLAFFFAMRASFQSGFPAALFAAPKGPRNAHFANFARSALTARATERV